MMQTIVFSHFPSHAVKPFFVVFDNTCVLFFSKMRVCFASPKRMRILLLHNTYAFCFSIMRTRFVTIKRVRVLLSLTYVSYDMLGSSLTKPKIT